MNVHNYAKSQELFQRAVKVIPSGIYGHLGPSEGCFVPVEAYPFYIDRAEGAYFWDVDGNRFIDYMCAYGPIVLGYRHPQVDEAVIKQMEKADCSILPSEKMVELAELLVGTIESADWAFFAKNGGDVTNLAVMTARAATGRKKIVKFTGGYHGVTQWTQGAGSPGKLSKIHGIKNIKQLVLYFRTLLKMSSLLSVKQAPDKLEDKELLTRLMFY